MNPTCSGAPAVTQVVPSDGVDNGGEQVTVSGSGFTGATGVTFGGVPCAEWLVVDDHTIDCTTPAMAAGDVVVAVAKGDQTGSLDAGYRFTGEAVVAIDWCDIQWPAEIWTQPGVETEQIMGQVHSPGVTEPDGAPYGVLAQVGYGPALADPRNEPGWRWSEAVWNTQYYENDESRGTLVMPDGDWSYGYRFSDDGGVNFMYCDFDPGTADGFFAVDLGTVSWVP